MCVCVCVCVLNGVKDKAKFAVKLCSVARKQSVRRDDSESVAVSDDSFCA